MSKKQEIKTQLAAPKLAYRPRQPQKYQPAIGLIGCGAITRSHLTAYTRAGYQVVALCDIDEAQARARQRAFYPEAAVYTNYHDLLSRNDIEVVDIATHPAIRVSIIEAALRARKHVLSQKPFVLDLAVGTRLADLADEMGVMLAVNQNGRYAPHFSYLRQAVQAGLAGQIHSLQMTVNWDHNGVVGREFNKIKHLILYDFAIHWFDMVACLLGQREALSVYAQIAHSPAQRAAPALLAHVLITYEQAQVSLVFNGDTAYGKQDTTTIIGTEGTLISSGESLHEQTVTLYTAGGAAQPKLSGDWFPDGFQGTMGELLCAIEENRQPENNGRDNLRGLALCFAAVASAETGQPQQPGQITTLETFQ
jgi:predicted dehydrogenase